MADALFIDTWGWLALGHKQDPFHSTVKSYYAAAQKNLHPVVTSDYVLDETITLIFRRETTDEAIKFMEGIYQSADSGFLTIERVTTGRFAAAWQLRKRLSDKPLISFTDIVSMVIMQERGIQRILTRDEHFLHVGMDLQFAP